jgi:subtilisin family serine protease
MHIPRLLLGVSTLALLLGVLLGVPTFFAAEASPAVDAAVPTLVAVPEPTVTAQPIGDISPPCDEDDDGAEFADDDLTVKFVPGMTPDAIQDMLDRHSLAVEDYLADLDVYVLETPPDQATALIPTVGAEPIVTWVELNYCVQGTLHPNDPDYNDPGKVYAPQLVNAEDAWDLTTGNGDLILAIVDSGLALGHPEFAGRIVPGYDLVNDDPDPSDDHGHGTHVAGIVAAAIDNGEGMAGIAPGVRIMPVKVLNASNVGTTAGMASGIAYAAEHGAKIINLSLATIVDTHVMRDAVQFAAARGSFMVVAAGNSGSGIFTFYPAGYPETMAVAATTRNDTRYVLSNFGNYVDIAAPGEGIWSTLWTVNEPRAYGFLTGTSMAAPHVSGLAALLLSLRPDLAADSLRTVIQRTATDLGDPGWDGCFGHGRIDVGAAVRALDTLYLIRINSGDGDYLDTRGSTWDKEQKWNEVWGFADGGRKTSDKPVSGTEDDRLYQTWHENPKEYRFVVPNGVYQVTLRMAEFEVDKPGERVMRITVEDAVVEDALDVYAEVGRYAVLDRTYRARVTDGQLKIGFARNGGRKEPAVSAIEVMPDLLATTPEPALRRVVSWDHDYLDSRGLTWGREQKWNGTWGFAAGGRKSSDKPVSGTADPTLYQRWHDDPRQYRYALPNGAYQVTMRFAEFETEKTGERVMQIAIEGDVVEPALDVCAAAGRYAALDRVYPVTVTDGELTIVFTQLANKHPMVSSIEVLPRP